MGIVIRDCTLDDRVVTVTLSGGHIASIEAAAPDADGGAGAGPDRVIDGRGLHLLPALRNGHTHVAMALLRGYGDDLPLHTWLHDRIWPAEARLTGDHIHAGARLGILEMIRSGTVFFNEMYWHVDRIAEAARELGVRAHLGSAFFDMGDPERERLWRGNVERDVERRDELGDLVELVLAPHAIYTVSPHNLRWISELARAHGLRLHTHLSETEKEVRDCLDAHGLRPTAHLDAHGVLGPDLTVAHCVWMEPGEFEMLARHGTTVAHNPCANLKLCTGGFLDWRTAKAAGTRIVLGTDGVASNNSFDLFDELKFAALVHKHRADDATLLPAREAWSLVTSEPSRAFGLGAGTVEVGEPADLILVDLSGPETCPGHDLHSDLVYAANGSVVHTTICAGRVLMHDRTLEVADEAEILHGAREAARAIVSG